MSVTVDHRRARTRTALAAVLTILMLVPAGVLFADVWGRVSDDRERTKLEQRGVEYLATLAPLVSALAEAQSSALSGVSTPPGSLTDAVAAVAAADLRLGQELSTRERWTGLREQIERLPSVTGTPVAVFQAHVEVTDLALALYQAVRNNSGLIRDPDNDVSHLQQALAVDLPGTVVQVSRMGDLSQLVAKANAQLRAQLAPQFAAAVQAVNASVNGLTDDLQSAVDDTTSTTLSGNLVSGLDSFRRGVESLTRGANPGGTPNPATMATAQSQLQVSLANLSGIAAREMAALLQERLDRLDNQALVALISAGAAILLALAAIALRAPGRRPTGPAARAGRGHEMTVGPTGRGEQVPAYGETYPTRREQTGALR